MGIMGHFGVTVLPRAMPMLSVDSPLLRANLELILHAAALTWINRVPQLEPLARYQLKPRSAAPRRGLSILAADRRPGSSS